MTKPPDRRHGTGRAGSHSLRARRRLFLSGTMLAGAVAFAALATLPALAGGGSGGGAGGTGGLGGADSTTGAPPPAGAASGSGGGGGGGAGTNLGGTGGNGAGAGAGLGGAGGSGAGDNGVDGTNGGVAAGGGGGGGTAGLVSPGSATTTTAVSGGTGGSGGSGVAGGGGGGGGAGGFGAIVDSGTYTITVTGNVAGGTGGAGGFATAAGGSGGSGGVGTILGSGATLSNSGIVTGGAGGAFGADASLGGAGGLGGAGVVGSGLTITNTSTGTISGGAGGNAIFIAGAGGAGILGANLTVINSGAITGGLSGHLSPVRANAITFTGGTNVLELQPGSAITGNVAAFSPTDFFRLGGSGAASFDVAQIGLAAQYQGFGIFQKTGSSTWTLTGSNATLTPWVIQAGTLAVSADNNLGSVSGGLGFAGGTLQYLAGFATSRAVTLNAGGGTFDTNGNTATLAGAIDGSGGLTKTGAGTLILAGTNTYAGGTTISAGTLAVSADNNLGSFSGGVRFAGGTLQFLAFFATPRFITLNAGGGTFDTNGNGAGLHGMIDGPGGLTKTGAGTLFLISSNNSYAGGTTISAGTLAVSADNNLGAVSGGLGLAGGTLQYLIGFATSRAVTLNAGGGTFDTNGNTATLAGTIGGPGGLTKTGAGTLILAAANSYAGTTTISAGTLLVNGSIVSPTVVNGGTLGGSGQAGSVTVNTGTLSPGNSIGTFTINGNLVLGAGAIYRVEVSPAAADRTNVSGSATLGGTAQLVFGPGSYASHSYTILSAAGGRTGTFATVTTEGLPAMLSASLSYTSTDVLLVTLASGIAQLPGLTPNQRASAAAQDRAFNSGLASITALFGLSPGQLPPALDALTGEVHVSTASVLADESLYVRSAVLGRLRQASYGGDMGAMAALRLGGPQVAFQQQNAFADEAIESALGYAKSPIVTKAPMRAPQATSDVVFWAQGFGAWGRFDGDGNAATVRRDLAGFITGVDTRVGTSGRAGVAAGYTGSRNTLDGRGSANVETGNVAGYGGWSFGALNLRAGAAYAFHGIDTDRTINFPGFFDRATAHYDGSTGQIFGEAGYGFAFGTIAVEPFAGGAWVRVKTDATAERGGLAALNFAGTTFETGYTTLGVRAASVVPIAPDMVLIPRGALAWQHAFNTVTPGAVLAFQTAPVAPFVIAGVPIARDSLLAEAGLDLAIGRNATVGVSYTGQIASNVQDHAAKGKFSWKF